MKVSRIFFLSAAVVLLLCIGISLTGCLPLQQTGETTQATQTTQSTESSASTTTTSTSALANWGTWIWLIILVAAFYFLLIRPQR
ncbi:MAG: hypothetical protein H5T85_07275, partial [Actinobacteria bacterium]|nr:hypothetical protein [Actinomycetota bacterium]